MSRFDDHKVQSDSTEALERDKAGPNRTVEIGSRFGTSKEAARIEMDRFRGVAEYETRKLFGQHSALNQPVTAEPARSRVDRKNARNHTATARPGAEKPAMPNAPMADSTVQPLEIFEHPSEVSE